MSGIGGLPYSGVMFCENCDFSIHYGTMDPQELPLLECPECGGRVE